ncbi:MULTISPECIES: response regulator transcription factor [Burkholderia]|uniref:LuxR C-terminal-related transcriptional regulator n=1 Tax=Burkholderia contaminans TaxID=488447 RepID=A0A250L4F6_9BURK|nr:MULTISPECIES: LuxR C-terminal-related transcriptional regulator [Burkholderia]MCA7878289.1 LuxR C-terminal-related transcriptional regulator [Burkholderia contaminans]MCA7907476.1 LuxR C-terminal-related transcriptional regulator [Burkholderia contaminans]MCA8185944.1 LuxR C-terminal-related transcriptional regulator [Burkholderia contaminans]MCA8367279.1 LuxR C-terminal-related transcriptional regulator [Burkholderia contaminans]MCQ4559496.1 LuxR C-terminal-related transcriptional regulato
MKLTTRETVVLGLISRGLTDREIAAELSVSVYTARKHRENLLNKFGFRKSAELTMRYFALFPDVLKKTVFGIVPTRSRRANAKS